LNNPTSESFQLKMTLNILVLILSLYGVSKRELHIKRVSLFEKMIIETFAPIQRGTVTVKGKLQNFFEHYLFLINTSKENDVLKKEISQLKGRIFQLNELSKENKRLKGLLKFGEELPMNKVLAQVIGRDLSTNFKILRINKGINDGVIEKSPVVTSDGLVGYIYRATTNFSDVLTILDPNNRVDGIISNGRTHGIVEGYKEFLCRMKYVISTEQVEEGDSVISAGLGNIYPKGLNIGRIEKIEKESYGITQFIVIKPAVDFHRLEEVIVLLKGQEGTVL